MLALVWRDAHLVEGNDVYVTFNTALVRWISKSNGKVLRLGN